MGSRAGVVQRGRLGGYRKEPPQSAPRSFGPFRAAHRPEHPVVFPKPPGHPPPIRDSVPCDRGSGRPNDRRNSCGGFLRPLCHIGLLSRSLLGLFLPLSNQDFSSASKTAERGSLGCSCRIRGRGTSVEPAYHPVVARAGRLLGRIGRTAAATDSRSPPHVADLAREASQSRRSRCGGRFGRFDDQKPSHGIIIRLRGALDNGPE